MVVRIWMAKSAFGFRNYLRIRKWWTMRGFGSSHLITAYAEHDHRFQSFPTSIFGAPPKKKTECKSTSSSHFTNFKFKLAVRMWRGTIMPVHRVMDVRLPFAIISNPNLNLFIPMFCACLFPFQIPVTLCNLGVGATFGESILHDLPRDSTVVTKTTCELLRVEQQDFRLIWEVSWTISIFLLRNL